MPSVKTKEIYAIVVHLNTGEGIEGYVRQGDDTEKGYWIIISRTPDLMNATYINRSLITHFELAEIK